MRYMSASNTLRERFVMGFVVEDRTEEKVRRLPSVRKYYSGS
jgi:hypothetical protein